MACSNGNLRQEELPWSHARWHRELERLASMCLKLYQLAGLHACRAEYLHHLHDQHTSLTLRHQPAKQWTHATTGHGASQHSGSTAQLVHTHATTRW